MLRKLENGEISFPYREEVLLQGVTWQMNIPDWSTSRGSVVLRGCLRSVVT